MRCKETLAETVQRLVDENADLKAQVRGSGKYERDCDGMAAEIRQLKGELIAMSLDACAECCDPSYCSECPCDKWRIEGI